MRLGRLVLNRRLTDTATVVSERLLALVVGRDGAGASGAATEPRVADIPAFASVALLSFQSTAAILNFASTATIPSFRSTATVPLRTTTATELWLTSP